MQKKHDEASVFTTSFKIIILLKYRTFLGFILDWPDSKTAKTGQNERIHSKIINLKIDESAEPSVRTPLVYNSGTFLILGD